MKVGVVMKKNKNILLIIVITVLLALIIFGIVLFFRKDNDNNKTKSKITDAIKFKEAYENLNNEKTDSGNTYPKVTLDDDNPFVYASAKKVVETLKSGTGLIYLGFSKCPWCRNTVNVLQYVNAKEILYLDITNHRDSYALVDGKLTKTKNGTNEYYEMLNLLDGILQDYEIENSGEAIKTGEKRVYVPLVVGVKNGEIVGYHTDTVDLNEDQTPYDLLTKKQQSDLKLIYDEISSRVFGDICSLDDDHGC